MEPEELLSILHRAEKLKCNTRHSDTSSGRRESVAEHSWRLSLMAMLIKDEFPEQDMDKVLRMCIIHDLGEAFTGDIPCFVKTDDDEKKEAGLLSQWVDSMPEPVRSEWKQLYAEMDAQQTDEARIYKCLDNLEAVIQHDEADLSSWLPLEYELQFTHGAERVKCYPWLQKLKDTIDAETRSKIEKGNKT